MIAPCEDISIEELMVCDEFCIIELAAVEEPGPADVLAIAAELDGLIIADEDTVDANGEGDEEEDELRTLLDDVDAITEVMLDGSMLELKALELIRLEEITIDELCELGELDELCTVEVLEDALETTIPATNPWLPAINVADAVLKKHIPPFVYGLHVQAPQPGVLSQAVMHCEKSPAVKVCVPKAPSVVSDPHPIV